MAVDDDTRGTLVAVARDHSRTRGGTVVFEFEDRLTDFATFEQRTNQIANAMLAAGLRPGDRVLYLGKNSDRFFEAMFGAMKIGAHIVPVGWRLSATETAYIAADADPKLVIVGPEGGPIAQALPQSCAAVRKLHVEPGNGASFDDWYVQADAGVPDYRPKPQDLAVQLYTSGTTGRPKGAMLTQGSFVLHLGNMFAADVAWNRWSSDDVSYLPMPLSHIGGTGWGIWGLYHGARTIIERVFDIEKTFDRIENKGVTKLFVVPSALQMMVHHPRARSIDYSRIRNMNYGASPISPALLRECLDVFRCGFTQMYGMTETIGTVVALAPEDHAMPGLPKIRAAGKPLPGVEIAILGADGTHLDPGGIGEVAIRSVAQMAGYWRLPQATAQTIDSEGWLHTGDAGYIDEDGYLFIHDRIKDMIVTGGENVYSVEVEAAIADHPDVADVAVIGIPSERWGEEVAAFVVLRPGRDTDAASIEAFVRTRLAGFKVPRTIGFVEELPRNPSGKILKRQLRAPFWEGRERQVS